MQRNLPMWLMLLVGLVGQAHGPDPTHAVEPARAVQHVGSDKQLFVDEVFFDRKERVQLVINPPIKDPQPVLLADKDKP